MLCLCLDCHVISSSGLQFYTYFWMAMLYHLLVCKFIPMSGLQVYTYFCYKVLYLLLLWLLLLFPNLISDLLYLFLVCYFIPTSVISNSGLFNFTGYGIVRYIVFRAPGNFLEAKAALYFGSGTIFLKRQISFHSAHLLVPA